MALQCFKQMLAVFFGAPLLKDTGFCGCFPNFRAVWQRSSGRPIHDFHLGMFFYKPFLGHLVAKYLFNSLRSESDVRCAAARQCPTTYFTLTEARLMRFLQVPAPSLPGVLNISVYMGWESTFMRIDCHVSNLLGDDQVYHFYTCVIIQMQSIHDLLLFSIYATVRYLGLQIVIIPNDDILVYTTFYLVMIILQMMMIIDHHDPWMIFGW